MAFLVSPQAALLFLVPTENCNMGQIPRVLCCVIEREVPSFRGVLVLGSLSLLFVFIHEAQRGRGPLSKTEKKKRGRGRNYLSIYYTGESVSYQSLKKCKSQIFFWITQLLTRRIPTKGATFSQSAYSYPI